MATVDISEPSTAAYSRCEKDLDKIVRLRAELDEDHGHRSQCRTARWWGLAALGVLLLTAIPHAPRIMCYIREQVDPGVASGWLALWGLSIGLQWAQWSLIGIFCILHEGPLWQRSLLYVGLGALTAITTYFASMFIDTTDHEMLYLAYAGPMLTIVMAVPVFLARVFCRWTLVLRSSKTVARPMSLSS